MRFEDSTKKVTGEIHLEILKNQKLFKLKSVEMNEREVKCKFFLLQTTMQTIKVKFNKNNIIVEVFQDGIPTTIDQTNVEIVSVIRGDDSVDITDVKNIFNLQR